MGLHLAEYHGQFFILHFLSLFPVFFFFSFFFTRAGALITLYFLLDSLELMLLGLTNPVALGLCWDLVTPHSRPMDSAFFYFLSFFPLFSSWFSFFLCFSFLYLFSFLASESTAKEARGEALIRYDKIGVNLVLYGK